MGSSDGGQASAFLNVVKQGHSFSGHERHCSFLNMGDGPFADVSSITGLDFPDDGRGVALTDWDQDGDLDMWISNRNGPQLRYLQNDYGGDNRSVSIRLRGVQANRDAIGARVELRFSNGAKPQSQTVRAGSGFLSQSSKWIHFGIEAADEIEKLLVTWPDGTTSEHVGISAGRFQLVQGGEPQSAPRRSIALPRIEAAGTELAEGTVQLRSFSLLPIPPSPFTSLNGERTPLLSRTTPLTLVVLFSSTCPPCLEELTEISARVSELRRRGIEVVALAIDALNASEEASRSYVSDTLRPLVARLTCPFPVGLASPEFVDRIQVVDGIVFDIREPLSVPMSLLLDSKRRVTCIYKGKVAVDRILEDRQKLEATAEQWRMATLPFPGRWIGKKKKRSLVPVVSELLDLGDVEGAAWYADSEFAKLLAKDPNWQSVRKRLADARAAGK